MTISSYNISSVHRLAKRLEDDIQQRGLKIGDRYLTAHQAAEMLGVSRATAQRAMKVLGDSEKLLRRRSLGTFVGPGSVNSSNSKVRTVYIITPEDEQSSGPSRASWMVRSLRQESGSTNVNFGIIPKNGGLGYVKQLLQFAQTAGQLVGVIATGGDREIYQYLAESGVPSNATLIDLDVPTGNSLSDFINWQTPAIMTGTTPTDGSYIELTPEAETTFGDAIASDLWDVGDGIWQNSGITDATGYTVEMSVKIGEPLDETMMGSGSLNATVANGRSAWVSYGQDGLFWGGSAGSLQIDATSNADDAYHSIRIIKEPGLDKFWVYRDGVVVNDTALTGFADARGMLTAGCMSDITIGTSEVDYLRFTPGAYVEVGADLPPAPPAPDTRSDRPNLFLDTFDSDV